MAERTLVHRYINQLEKVFQGRDVRIEILFRSHIHPRSQVDSLVQNVSVII